MTGCLFCNIVDKKINAEILDENDFVLAFRDINPQASTHVLIIPKMHISSTIDLNSENVGVLSDMALMANKISVSEKIINSGNRWVINTGSDGGQTVFHIHLHLLGGRQFYWPPG